MIPGSIYSDIERFKYLVTLGYTMERCVICSEEIEGETTDWKDESGEKNIVHTECYEKMIARHT